MSDAEERGRIVAYLRREAETYSQGGLARQALALAADDIENEQHLQEGTQDAGS